MHTPILPNSCFLFHIEMVSYLHHTSASGKNSSKIWQNVQPPLPPPTCECYHGALPVSLSEAVSPHPNHHSIVILTFTCAANKLKEINTTMEWHTESTETCHSGTTLKAHRETPQWNNTENTQGDTTVEQHWKHTGRHYSGATLKAHRETL